MESLLNGQSLWFLALAVLWTLPWKGYALWTAAKKSQRIWFIVIIIFNTFGLLEIFYVFFIAKKTPKDIINALKSHL